MLSTLNWFQGVPINHRAHERSISSRLLPITWLKTCWIPHCPPPHKHSIPCFPLSQPRVSSSLIYTNACTHRAHERSISIRLLPITWLKTCWIPQCPPPHKHSIPFFSPLATHSKLFPELPQHAHAHFERRKRKIGTELGVLHLTNTEFHVSSLAINSKLFPDTLQHARISRYKKKNQK